MPRVSPFPPHFLHSPQPHTLPQSMVVDHKGKKGEADLHSPPWGGGGELGFTVCCSSKKFWTLRDCTREGLKSRGDACPFTRLELIGRTQA